MTESSSEHRPSPGIAPGLAGPAREVRAGWIAWISLANLGLYVGYYGPLQVLLPNQAQAIAGTTHDVMALGWVTAIGAVAAMITQPVVGALSDRTTGRLGCRRPWILGGALLAALALAFLAGQRTIAGMIVGWTLAQAGLNALQSALTAGVPDSVPVRQRGFVSGWISVQMTIGVVAGVALVSLIVTGNGGYALVALVVLAFALPFALLTKPVRLAREDLPAFSWGEFARSFWVSPQRHPGFAWAWLTRFLVMLGGSMATLYLLYFLRDRVRFHQLYPRYTVEEGLLLLVVIYTIGALASAVTCGRISDRSGRRKPLVTISGVVTAVPAVFLAAWPDWWVTVVCALVLGLGYGAYLAVDLALVTQVLPSKTGHAKDLGIINVAAAGPQVLAPAIAAPIVGALGGYPALYAVVAVIVLLGAVLVWKIPSVR
jgi:MFS family permease